MKKISILTALLALLVTSSMVAQAQGWVTTGGGTRFKKIAFVNVKVYYLSHQVKGTAPAKNAAAMISTTQEKRFFLKMLREVDSEKIVTAIKEAYALNGYSNVGNATKLWSPVIGSLAENDMITISYANGNTTVSYKGKSSTLPGDDLMKATWSIWFGKIDQPGLTTGLMSSLP